MAQPTLDPEKNLVICMVQGTHTAGDTTLNLETGEGAKLLDPATYGEYNVPFWNMSDHPGAAGDKDAEIVRITAVSGNSATMVRAQEGTAATAKDKPGKQYAIAMARTAKFREDLVARTLGLSGLAQDATLSGGAFTLTKSLATVDTEAAAAVDDLVTINGGVEGQVITLFQKNSARRIQVKSGGNIRVPGLEVWLSDTRDSLTLILHSALWRTLNYQSHKGWVSYGEPVTYSVVGGAFTPLNSNCKIDNSSGTVTISTITAMPAGVEIVVHPLTSANNVTLDQAGNLILQGTSFTMNSLGDKIKLMSNGTEWEETTRSDN